MGRESTYQKLKRELAESRRELNELALRPDSFTSTMIRARIQLLHNAESQVWFSSSKQPNNYFKGIGKWVKPNT